jgi:hypothetical protein
MRVQTLARSVSIDQGWIAVPCATPDEKPELPICGSLRSTSFRFVLEI